MIEEAQGYRLSTQQMNLINRNKNTWIEMLVQVVGDINIPMLINVIQEITDKHESLKTIYKRPLGMKNYFQYADKKIQNIVNTFDLTDVEDVESRLLTILDEQKICEIDLEQSPVRITIVKVTSSKTLVSFKVPQLSADEKSLINLYNELSKYLVNGDLSFINNEPLQYINYAEWLQEVLSSEESEEGFSYWKKLNISSFVNMSLPFEKPIDSIENINKKSIELNFSAQQLKSIEKISNITKSSLSEVVFSFWQITIWRFLDSDRIVVGKAIENRPFEEMELSIGLYSQTIPFLVELNENMTISELISNNKSQIEEIIDWQYYFDEAFLSQSQKVIYPFGYKWVDIPPEVHGDSSSIKIIRIEDNSFNTKVNLSCYSFENEIKFKIEYNPNLISSEYVKEISKVFGNIVTSLCKNPNQEIENIEIIDSQERMKLLNNSSNPNISCTINTVKDKFEEQAIKVPNHIAVRCESGSMTYKELNEKANQLSHYFDKMGLRPGGKVGICLERSPELIYSMLGILKSGCAYIPIDPAFPKERIEFILADSEIDFLVLSNATQNSLPETYRNTINLDKLEKSLLKENSFNNPEIIIDDEQLAYIIYTSGSTGRPKGVMITHKNLMNYYLGLVDTLKLPDGASYAAVSTIAADLGNTAIFPALCGGGTLHLISKERAINAKAFSEYLDKNPIDVLKIVPSHFMMLLEASKGKNILPCKYIIFGGETLKWDLIKKIKVLNTECSIINHYGPTETTVGSLVEFVKDTEEYFYLPKTVPLGRPLPGSEVLILDCKLELVPIGIKGEIYIGGDGVSKGYINNDKKENFVQLPWGNNKIFYKTGDLAHYLPDGRIEFLGRSDDLIKIRGNRVDLGEIESVIQMHPSVKHAVVLYDEIKQVLISFYIKEEETGISSSELKDHIKKYLPEFMIPNQFTSLTNFPFNENGKLDKNALLLIDSSNIDQKITYVAPSDGLEEELVALWEELLEIKPIGIKDEFLTLGGNSLIGILFISEFEERFGLNLPLVELYKYDTIKKLADFIRNNQTITKSYNPIVPLKHSGNRPPLFCVHPGGGNVGFYKYMADSVHPEIPIYGIEASGYSGEEKPSYSIPGMATTYVKSIQKIQPNGPYYLAGWSFGGVVAYEVGLRLKQLGEEVAFIGMFDTCAPVSYYKSKDSIDDQSLLKGFAEEMGNKFGIKEINWPANIKFNNPKEIITFVANEIEQKYKLDKTIQEVLNYYEVFKAHRHAFYYYEPKGGLERVTLFRSTENIQLFHGSNPHPTFWWSEIVPIVETFNVKGDHLTMIQDPTCASYLGNRLSMEIEKL